jgi:mRNA-degrading endonuclease RelE of RelBE toxin-antitoxin system
MVDRIKKVLRKLQPKELKQLTEMIKLVQTNQLIGKDIKKLQDRNDVFRVRHGDFRIIFRRFPGSENQIIAIERRSDTTYNDW